MKKCIFYQSKCIFPDTSPDTIRARLIVKPLLKFYLSAYCGEVRTYVLRLFKMRIKEVDNFAEKLCASIAYPKAVLESCE